MGIVVLCDWWSLGIITYELVVGLFPFFDSDPVAIYDKVLKGLYKFPKNIDSNTKAFIERMLVADTKKRYGKIRNGKRLDVYYLKWFREFNWKKLDNMVMNPFFVPKIKNYDDTKNFQPYFDEDEDKEIEPEKDPFINW